MSIGKKENVNYFNKVVVDFLIENHLTLDQLLILHLKYWEDNTSLIRLCANIPSNVSLASKIIKKYNNDGTIKSQSVENYSERYTTEELSDLVNKGLIKSYDYDRELRTSFIELTDYCSFILDKFYRNLFPTSKEDAVLEDLEERLALELFESYPNTAYSAEGKLITQLKSFKHMNRKECFRLYYSYINGDEELHKEIVNKVKANYAELKNNIPTGNYHLCIGFTKFVESQLWNDLPVEESNSMYARREG